MFVVKTFSELFIGFKSELFDSQKNDLRWMGFSSAASEYLMVGPLK